MNTLLPSDQVLSQTEVYEQLAAGEDIPALQVTKEGFHILTSDNTDDDVDLMDLFGGC